MKKLKEKEDNIKLYPAGEDTLLKKQELFRNKYKFEDITPGDAVKLAFDTTEDIVEFMWVGVNAINEKERLYIGSLDSIPVGELIRPINLGDEIIFEYDHIYDLDQYRDGDLNLKDLTEEVDGDE